VTDADGKSAWELQVNDALSVVDQIRGAVNEERLLETATKLITIPSPTRSAAAVADCLAETLKSDGFAVVRADCGWPDAPAVIARLESGRPGPTIQFNGHLDTVHLPFVPPRVENGILYGSGSSDMKGGIAAMVEAARAVKDAKLLDCGTILVTAHDLHESPWGDGSQVEGLIEEGFVGNLVLLPEYCSNPLPIAGRGLAILEVSITRAGEPVHEVLGGIEQPNVIYAGAALVQRIQDIDQGLQGDLHATAGRASMFVGKIHAGEIYNQSPIELQLSGTRRWLPGTDVDQIRTEFDGILNDIAAEFGVSVDGKFHFVRDAYEIDGQSSAVDAFQTAHEAVTGERLPIGAKPFVDDGNLFVHRCGIPAITHGPNATGAHTLHEQVAISELVRVAEVYALTAIHFCCRNK
jgi:acetylornithine deacetylase/succinyl-diaminopimelate desuccinylase-like protein